MPRKTSQVDTALCFQLEQDPVGAAARYYATCLAKNQNVATFLANNCLLPPTAQAAHCSQLGLGYCDRSLPKFLPPHYSNAGKEMRRQLIAAGLLRSTAHEILLGCLTVPLTDLHGQVTGIYGFRVVADKGGKVPRDARPESTVGKGIFAASAIGRYSELILTDNVLSALAFHAAGHENAIAVCKMPLSADSLRGVKRLLLAYANTDEGNAEVARLVQEELPEGIAPHRILFPLDHDARKFVLEYREVPDALAQRIRAASWIEPVQFQESASPAGRPSGKLAKDAKPETAKPKEKAAEETPPPTEPQPTPAQPAQPEPTQTPTASPVPVFAEELPTTVTDTEVTIEIETRHWRIRGLDRNSIGGVMKVNLLVTHNEHFHVDTLDLYHSRSRKAFLVEAAHEVGAAENTLRTDLGRVLLKLEQLQTQQAQQAKHPQDEVTLTDGEREAALELLQDPRLVDRILAGFETCGVVGEPLAKLYPI